jgi:hypothetical protein
LAFPEDLKDFRILNAFTVVELFSLEVQQGGEFD